MAEVDTSGIYIIRNKLTDKLYVGSAINIGKRWKFHIYKARLGKHGNRYIQKSFLKYGEDKFEFSVIEYCEKVKLIEREQFWMDELKPEYNLAPKAGSVLGMKFIVSEERRKKLSKVRLGAKLTERQKQNRRNYKHTEEAKRKIGSRKNWNHSQEAKSKMSISAKTRIRKPLSEETKLKLSIAAKQQWQRQKG